MNIMYVTKDIEMATEDRQAGALSYGEIPPDLLEAAARIICEWEDSADARGRAPARRIIMMAWERFSASHGIQK